MVFVGDAHIHHLHLVAKVVSHGAHARAVAGHIHRLGRRNASGRDRHPFPHHTVIRAEDDDTAGRIAGGQGSGDAAQANVDIFQFSQAAGRLGQSALVHGGPGHGAFVGGGDKGQLPAEHFFVIHSFKNPFSSSQVTFPPASRVSSV